MKNETEKGEKDSDKVEAEEPVSAKDHSYWKKLILEVDDRKILEYIKSLCEARMQIGRADHEATSKTKKDKYGSVYTPPPQQMKPIFPTAEDPEKMV